MAKLQLFRLISILGSYLAGVWIPLRFIGFAPAVSWDVGVGIVLSFVGVLNIYLRFISKNQSMNQLKNWLKISVIIDVFSAVPFLTGISLWGESRQLLPLILFNFLTVRHIKNIRSFMDGYPSIHPVVFRMIPLIVSMPLLVHVVSCIWIFLGSGTAGIDEDATLTYVKAIYWSFTTLTTVGYGDISAKTISQMLFACSVEFVGVGVFGFILSNVAAILARSDAARNHHMENLDRVETFMEMHHIPLKMREKIRTYYHYVWMNKKGYQDDSLIEGLPEKLQSEMLLFINKPIIEKVPFLKGAGQDLLAQLMGQLRARIYVPEEDVFLYGERGDALYFIQTGQVDILTKEGQCLATLGDGAFFGEMALISDNPRMATARCKNYCDIYILDKKSFNQVLDSHPLFQKVIQETIEKRKAA